MNTIETKRLILRNIVEADAEDIYSYCKEVSVGLNAGWPPHKDIEDTKFIMAQIFIGQPLVFGIVLKPTNKIIGTVGLLKDPKRANPNAMMLGYAMGEEYWGQGIMTEASKAVMNYGFSLPDIDIITCCCYTYNNRSRRVIEKCGFEYEGCIRQAEKRYDGQVLDFESFSLLKSEYQK